MQMSKAAAKQTTTRAERKQNPAPDGRTIALQFIDTTWRVALPIILLCYIGIRLDRHYHSAPLYALIGLFVALAMAVILVYKQIKSAYPEFFKGGKS
jgi:F0F1-type ATP synthase assembly protein I